MQATIVEQPEANEDVAASESDDEESQTAMASEQMETSEEAPPASEPDDNAPLTATIAEELQAGEEPTASPDPAAVAEQESHVEAKDASGDVGVLAHGTVTMDPPSEVGDAVSSAGSETATERSVKT